MIGIGTAIKWGALVIIVGLLAKGLSFGYEYHLDQIDKAVNEKTLEIAIASAKSRKIREDELREESVKDKKRIQAELRVEKDKVDNLERMLLIDHDLDRLLQRKPGLILTIVNKGTEDYYKELEETTQ